MRKWSLRKDPEIRLYFPVWYHHHGMKMRVKELNKEKQTLIISGSAASVSIGRAPIGFITTAMWSVEWKIIWSPAEFTGGRIIFNSDELRAAFGLSDDSGEHGDWLIERFGGDSAEQGKYIRWKKFLNIPCPGTGHDGDPNVSIDIDEEMRNAVKQLLALA